MMKNHSKVKPSVFSYRTHRMLIGVIAFVLPIAVIVTAKAGGLETQLSSISAYYHTQARDVFVGSLFAVGFFLFSYNGWRKSQGVLSKIAGVSAILVALAPTHCPSTLRNIPGYCYELCWLTSPVHTLSAVVLFSILFVFCWYIFQIDIKSCEGTKKRRSIIYYFCAAAIAICGTAAMIKEVLKLFEALPSWMNNATFYIEWIALWAFGVSWIVSGKYLPWLKDQENKNTKYSGK